MLVEWGAERDARRARQAEFVDEWNTRAAFLASIAAVEPALYAELLRDAVHGPPGALGRWRATTGRYRDALNASPGRQAVGA